MRQTTIARNYAEALLALARKANDLEGWGRMIGDVAEAMRRDERLRRFLETPQISGAQKSAVIGKAFQDRMPRLFVRYLQTVLAHRRQMLIPVIADEYRSLVDEAEGRLHALVTVARPPGEPDRAVITQSLTRALGREVVPTFTVNPAILGGVVVRVGDTVMDGSVRRRLATLRARMVSGAAR